jgi:hypothetical protein
MNVETIRIALILFVVCVMGAYFFIVEEFFNKRDYDAKFQQCIKEQMHLTHTRQKAGEICEQRLR